MVVSTLKLCYQKYIAAIKNEIVCYKYEFY